MSKWIDDIHRNSMRDTVCDVSCMVEEEDVYSGEADKRIDVKEEDAVKGRNVGHGGVGLCWEVCSQLVELWGCSWIQSIICAIWHRAPEVGDVGMKTRDKGDDEEVGIR